MTKKENLSIHNEGKGNIEIPLPATVLCILHLPAWLQISCTKLWQHLRRRSAGSSDTLCSQISIGSCSNYNPCFQLWEDNKALLVILSPLTPRGYRNHQHLCNKSELQRQENHPLGGLTLILNKPLSPSF